MVNEETHLIHLVNKETDRRSWQGPFLERWKGWGSEIDVGMAKIENTVVGRLRVVGWLEGASYLLLLFVAMPLKYLAGQPQAVQVVGMAHGVLFIAFCLAAVHAAVAKRWPLGTLMAAFVSSVLPFGPFVFDAWALREEDTPEPEPSR